MWIQVLLFNLLPALSAAGPTKRLVVAELDSRAVSTNTIPAPLQSLYSQLSGMKKATPPGTLPSMLTIVAPFNKY
jgi:hypothetical protein